MRYQSTEAEYEALTTGLALVDRSQRGFIEVRGKDRIEWAHGKSTNTVKSLKPGQGNYAFFLDNKGRIQFEGHLTVKPESVWLDIESAIMDSALVHLNKYIITEAVELIDRSADQVRIGLTGAKLPEALKGYVDCDLSQLAIGWVGTLSFAEQSVEFIRTDFCGPIGIEFFAPSDQAKELWSALSAPDRGIGAIPAGDQAVEMLRIESGIPWFGRDISNNTLPEETGQSDRAVSLNKGCFLGHEVVERMRSRGMRARRLMGIRIASEDLPPREAPLLSFAGEVIGQITSMCHSEQLKAVIALGYVKTGDDNDGKSIRVQWPNHACEATLVELPFV